MGTRLGLVATVALSSAFSLTACGSEDADHGADPSGSSAVRAVALPVGGAATLERLREGMRYVAYATPQQLMADRPVGLLGVVEEVVEGRSLISASRPHPIRDNSVVVRVRVTQILKDPGNLIRDGVAYVSIPRGVNALHSDGTIVGEDPNPSMSEVKRAIPAGLRVVAISQPHNEELALRNPAVTIGEDPNPVPDGAVLLEGIHPQTFVVDHGQGDVIGWPDRTFADLLRELTS